MLPEGHKAVPGKNKLDAECHTFNQMHDIWRLELIKFTATIEDNLEIRGQSCNFICVPGPEYRMA